MENPLRTWPHRPNPSLITPIQRIFKQTDRMLNILNQLNRNIRIDVLLLLLLRRFRCSIHQRLPLPTPHASLSPAPSILRSRSLPRGTRRHSPLQRQQRLQTLLRDGRGRRGPAIPRGLPSQLGIFRRLDSLNSLESLGGLRRLRRLRRLRGLDGRESAPRGASGASGAGGVLGTEAEALGVGVLERGVESDVEEREARDVVELLPLRERKVPRDGSHGEDVERVLVEALQREPLDVDGVVEEALGGGRRGARRGGRLEGRRVGVFGRGGGGEEGRFGERRGELGLGARRGEVDGGGDGGRFEVEELLLEVDEVLVVAGNERRAARTSS